MLKKIIIGLLSLLTIIFCLILGLSLYTMINAKINNSLPFLFNYSTAEVVSESMLPVLKKDDTVIIKKINEEEQLKGGKIYVYQKGDILIIHRLMHIQNSSDETDNNVSNDCLYFFKGDNNEVYDEPFSDRNLIIGECISAVNFKFNFTATIAILSLGLFMSSIFLIWVLVRHSRLYIKADDDGLNDTYIDFFAGQSTSQDDNDDSQDRKDDEYF